MLPDLTVLLAVLLGLLTLEDTRVEDPAQALIGSVLCLLIGGALSRMALSRGLRAIDEDDLFTAEASSRWAVGWPFLAWMAALFFFSWGPLVYTTVPREWWMARYAVLFVPALIVFAVGWAGRAELEAEVISRKGGVSLATGPVQGIRRGLRKNAVLLLPLAVLLGIQEALYVGGHMGIAPLKTFSLWSEAMPLLGIGFMFVLVMLALPFLPRIFARALRAEPLAPGRLRTVLEEAAAKINLRYRDIMVWPTGGRVFNAMVVGFTPGTRTIFMTDGLLHALPEDEILAVFFHEAGHAKRHHIPLFVMLFFSTSLLFYAGHDPLYAIGFSGTWQVFLHLAVIWFVLLGWVSRRFERESDIYGAKHAAILEPDAEPVTIPGLSRAMPRGAAMMVGALERIRTIAGYSGSHRHGSVEDRVVFVTRHATEDGVRSEYKRARRALKLGIWGVAALAVAVTIWRMPIEIAHAEAHVTRTEARNSANEAWDLAHSKKVAEVDKAPEAWRKAYDGFRQAADRVRAFDDRNSRIVLLGAVFNAADTALHGLRERETARKGFEEALRLSRKFKFEGTSWTTLRFHCHIELGRLAAWTAAENPGEDGPDMTATLEHLEAARRLLDEKLKAAEDLDEEIFQLLSERGRLLDATYEGARGEVAEGRKALEILAKLGGSTTEATRRPYQELAEDAQRELDRLQPPR